MKISILNNNYNDLINLLDEFLKGELLSTLLTKKKSDKINYKRKNYYTSFMEHLN